MTANVENIIRNTAAMDPSISPKMVEMAVKVLRGEPLAPQPPRMDADKLPPILTYREAREILKLKRSAFFKLIRIGRLKRVMGTGRMGIGITRKSFLNAYEGRFGRARD